MPAKRLSMRKIRDVLRLRFQSGLSLRQIACTIGVGHSTVWDYIERAEAAGLSWPLPPDLSDEQIERLLFPKPAPSRIARPEPDWHWVHRELRQKGVTLMLLWQEYKSRHGEGYQYSRFCDRYRHWRGRLDLVMRQEHRAGEKLFVDYAGQSIAVTEAETGQVRQAQIFVAVLGCSNYTYAEATFTQSLPDWIASHQRAFHFFGGVPAIVVPDNLKAGVHRAHRYEPDLNPSYQDLAAHYGVAVVPARVRRPRDKAKVEAGTRRTLDSGASAPPMLLQPRRTQRGHRRTPGEAQQPALQEDRGFPPKPLPGARPTGAAPVAGDALRLCPVEEGARAPRLSRRGRGTLLQRALSVRPAAD
jgi:transposase